MSFMQYPSFRGLCGYLSFTALHKNITDYYDLSTVRESKREHVVEEFRHIGPNGPQSFWKKRFASKSWQCIDFQKIDTTLRCNDKIGPGVVAQTECLMSDNC